MHLAAPELGILGANGIIGAHLPIAAGAAKAAQLRGRPDVAVAFFGDGAVAQGAFHEAVNLAVLWKLPVVFFCENNHYAEFSPTETQQPVTLAQRALGYGIPFLHLDGNDVTAVTVGMEQVVEHVRAGNGPYLVEAETYRWRGHYEGDPERYRTVEEVDAARLLDPLVEARHRLEEAGVPAADLDAVVDSARDRILQASERAARAPEPAVESLGSFVLSERAEQVEPPVVPPDAEVFRTMDAVREALAFELEADESVFTAGIDIAAGGGVFGLTRGLAERFPGRVLDTPISETAITGMAVGAAMMGMRPVVEVMYLDFIGVCFDQLVNQAAKMRFMTGGGVEMAWSSAPSSAQAARPAASTRRAWRRCWRTFPGSP